MDGSPSSSSARFFCLSVLRLAVLSRILLPVLLQCLFDRFGSVFPQCGLMVFPGVVIVSR